MTKGSPYRLLLGFTIPLFFGNLFQQMYSMVDTIVVGRFAGIEALAAVGATGGFVFMVTGFGQGLATGFAVPVSQKYGAKDTASMRKNYAMGLVLSLVVGLVISLIFALSSFTLLKIVRTPENIIGQANSYILVIYLGLTLIIYYNFFSAILRAVGDSKSPLIFLVISSILNIILDLFLVIVIPLGCMGVAIATVISQAVSAFLAYIYISLKYPIFKLSRSDWRINTGIMYNLLRIGIPGGIQFSVCAIGVIIVQAAINSFGSDLVAAYSVGAKIENLMTTIFPVLGMAISTFAGQNLGAMDIPRIKKGFKDVCVIAFFSSIIFTLLTYFSAEHIAYIFVDRNTTSPLIIEQATFYARTVSFFYIPLVSIFIFRTGCQGLGSGSIPMISSIVELVCRIITAFTLPALFGFMGVVISSPIAWIGGGIICPICYLIYMRRLEERIHKHNPSL